MTRGAKRFRLGFALLAVAVLLVLAIAVAGCGKKTAESPQNGKNPGVVQEPGENGDDRDAGTQQAGQKVTLYFSDDQAMYLVPEEREVVTGGDTLEAATVKELIKGPRKAGLNKTIPEGTKLLSVSVQDGVAYVNFSKEFKTKHWGGSAGETMTIYSVVNTLCKLPGIQKVQFLLEGDRQESILDGNMDTSVPVEPDFTLVRE
jgi:spore germination protein GerM